MRLGAWYTAGAQIWLRTRRRVQTLEVTQSVGAHPALVSGTQSPRVWLTDAPENQMGGPPFLEPPPLDSVSGPRPSEACLSQPRLPREPAACLSSHARVGDGQTRTLPQQPSGLPLSRARQAGESPRPGSREPQRREGECRGTWGYQGPGIPEGGPQSTCCGVPTQEEWEAPDLFKACMRTGLEAGREEDPVCLRSPRGMGKHMGAAHSWSEGLLPTGL